MDTEGTLAPETPAEAREEYGTLVPAAKVTVREAARAMSFDREEYGERVTVEVIETVRDALFASLLRVHVGTQTEFDEWLESNPEYDRDVIGSENVEYVVWHPVPFEGVAVAATFHEEREAALGTLRRRTFGEMYRELLTEDDSDDQNSDEERDSGASDRDGDGNEVDDGDTDAGDDDREA